jgi:hypothetical protein
MGSKFLVVVCWVFMAGDNSGFNLEQHMKTGWPPGLLQDDERKLSRWFASRPDARYQLRKNMKDDDDTMCCRSELEAAVKAKREACAKMVEDWDSDSADPRDIADAIRARGQDPMPLFDDWPGGWK